MVETGSAGESTRPADRLGDGETGTEMQAVICGSWFDKLDRQRCHSLRWKHRQRNVSEEGYGAGDRNLESV